MNKIILNLIGILACSLLIQANAQTAVKPTQPSKQVSILFVGDMVLDDLPGKAIEQGQDPFAAFEKIFNSADIRVGNLECVIATTGKATEKNFTFRAHPRALLPSPSTQSGSRYYEQSQNTTRATFA